MRFKDLSAVLTLNCKLLKFEKPPAFEGFSIQRRTASLNFESFRLVFSWKAICFPLSMEVGSYPGILQTSLTSPLPFSSQPRLGTSFTLRNLLEQAACGKADEGNMVF